MLGVITPVISNLASAIGLFIKNIAEREKSIWQRNDSFKLNRPLTIKLFEVTGVRLCIADKRSILSAVILSGLSKILKITFLVSLIVLLIVS